MSWLSNAWNGISGFFSDAAPIINAATSIFGTIQGNKNVDKSLAAQQQENEATREYEREMWTANNAYNSPMQQKARLEAAGLNADMMYGQGGVSNTSPAPPHSVAPMDWSSLANKRTVGDAIMQGLAIQQARANVHKTEAEARSAGVEADALEMYGLETSELNKEFIREQLNKVKVEAEGINYDNTEKQIKHEVQTAYRSRYVENLLESLEASTQMTKNALKEDIETLTLRIAGINAENSRLVRMAPFTTSEWRLVFDVIRELLSFMK